jgi:ABC-type branched-subunit amino acid transport system substrate-binding protein
MRTIALRGFGALVLLALLPGPWAHAEEGVTKDTILIGRSAGMTGSIAARMKPATEAMIAYFNAVNEAGGINGRRIKLINLDDGNDAKRAGENATRLINEDKVFAMFSPSGTPATQVVMPIATAAQVPLIASTSGADSLRKPNRYFFHLKGSYGDEFAKIAEHLKTTGVSRVVIINSDDGAGREGRQLAEQALEHQGLKAAAAIGFKPGAVKAALAQMAKFNPQAVILPSLAGPGAEFYKEFVKLPDRPQVFTWSIMVVEGIYKEVGEKAYGLVEAQIVPSPADKTFAVSRDYQAMLKKAGLEDGGYSGIEGYISARVLVEGLKRAGRDLTRDKLIAALEAMHDYDLGGDLVNFGPDHVGRRFVELTIVGRDGRFLH